MAAEVNTEEVQGPLTTEQTTNRSCHTVSDLELVHFNVVTHYCVFPAALAEFF